MTFPSFIDQPVFAVKSGHQTVALFLVSLAALLSNVALAVLEVWRIVKTKRNPLKQELHRDLAALLQAGVDAGRRALTDSRSFTPR